LTAIQYHLKLSRWGGLPTAEVLYGIKRIHA
jgi:hypothetical protein